MTIEQIVLPAAPNPTVGLGSIPIDADMPRFEAFEDEWIEARPRHEEGDRIWPRVFPGL